MDTERLEGLIRKVSDKHLKIEFEQEHERIQTEHQRWIDLLEQRSNVLFAENEELKTIIQEAQRRYEKAVREMQFYKKRCEESDDWRSSISTTSSQSTESIFSETKSARPSISTQRSSVYQTGNSMIQQRKSDPLAFGGSDALWDTIAKNQGSSDVTVEKLINNFLRRGGSPNTAKQSPTFRHVKYGYGMIHAMIVIQAPRPLDLILQQGANPNVMTLSQIDEDKVSPCYLASSLGWLSGLQRLVQAGGDLMSARGGGHLKKTALHAAVENGHFSVAEYIIYHTQGVLNQETDSKGATALHYASASGQTHLVTYIIQSCQLSPNAVDDLGQTPLHWASQAGKLEVVMLLIEKYKSDPNAYVPKQIGTPFDLAKLAGHKKVMDYVKYVGGTTAKKLDKNMSGQVPEHLESALAMNGFFMN